MENHPISNFPLLPSDQADVIQIFLELMQEGDRAERASQAASSEPLKPCNDFDPLWFLGQPPNFE